ncbi:MAG TPA: threonine--tRNA ligase [Nitrospinota bacterium]|nr:threonine--tRNA ligase [Nitrospinota bacterium]HJN02255.1 threonine--tRNA ligase [Nitrospinota bacterium]
MTNNKLEKLRHSTAHVMAQAVKRLYPETLVTIGPAIENGFYYDFDREEPFKPEDLQKIEKLMHEIVKENFPVVRSELNKEEALKFFEGKGEKYKKELITEIEDEEVSIYTQGEFADLCRGPHVGSTGDIKSFKLLSVAGSYWRGDENNKMLQRIYGIAFYSRKDLGEYLDRLEEAKKRDHRKLGKELDLFHVDEEIGSGLILWHPKGALVRTIIEDFWRKEHYKNGYQILYSPHIARAHLWETSEHLNFYKENMYSPMDIDGTDYIVKPMNCPFHIKIYNSRLRSYRELPFRWAELGTVYRYEKTGVLHGLLRVRGFTQDDAHIFCRSDQLPEEISKALDFTIFILRSFGFEEYQIYLSTKPDKFVGSEESWEKATTALKGALDKSGMAYEIDAGEGVFYGPKIDVKIKDSLGRAWQCSTIQVDFNLPERFKISYIGEDGQPHQPIMIHRALMGSLERFFGCLIEHFAGAFPTWLAPVQVRILTITDNHIKYAEEISEFLKKDGIRVELDSRNEKVGFKIREAQTSKIPYMLIIGDKEIKDKEVAVRKRKEKKTETMDSEDFLSKLNKEIISKK